MRKRGSIVLALGGVWLAPYVSAQDAEVPDLEFLEYLGSWQGEDDEWFVIAEWEKDSARKPDGGKDLDENDDDQRSPNPKRETDDEDEGT